VRDMIDPSAYRIALHETGIVGLQQFGRRDDIRHSQPNSWYTQEDRLEERRFPNVAEANGLRPTSKLSATFGD
jgi:hypothetical protein